MSHHWPKQHDGEIFACVDRILVGASAPMVNLKKMLSLVGPCPSPVLIQGDTGVGKELAARAVHDASGRTGALVAVNCAAIPQELLESELFGHEKGAFTGADSRRVGKIESSMGGTLFLDEIGDMPLELQAKLLRVLETKKISPIGGNREIDVDFRLVTATHRDIASCVEGKTFREDLFYRINVFCVKIPSLSERVEDIPQIMDRLMVQYVTDYKLSLEPHFSEEAVEALTQYAWPGNVRELRNVVERAFVLFGGQVITRKDISHLLNSYIPLGQDAESHSHIDPAKAPSHGDIVGQTDLRSYLRDIEKEMINCAMEQVSDNVTQAADLLGLQRTTLVEKLKKIGFDRSKRSAELA